MTVCRKLPIHITYYSDVTLTSMFQGIIASCVQLCFAWRVKIITNNIWVVILIVSCAIVSMRKLTLLSSH
jgi:hypothetical protein